MSKRKQTTAKAEVTIKKHRDDEKHKPKKVKCTKSETCTCSICLQYQREHKEMMRKACVSVFQTASKVQNNDLVDKSSSLVRLLQEVNKIALEIKEGTTQHILLQQLQALLTTKALIAYEKDRQERNKLWKEYVGISTEDHEKHQAAKENHDKVVEKLHIQEQAVLKIYLQLLATTQTSLEESNDTFTDEYVKRNETYFREARGYHEGFVTPNPEEYNEQTRLRKAINSFHRVRNIYYTMEHILSKMSDKKTVEDQKKYLNQLIGAEHLAETCTIMYRIHKSILRAPVVDFPLVIWKTQTTARPFVLTIERQYADLTDTEEGIAGYSVGIGSEITTMITWKCQRTLKSATGDKSYNNYIFKINSKVNFPLILDSEDVLLPPGLLLKITNRKTFAIQFPDKLKQMMVYEMDVVSFDSNLFD